MGELRQESVYTIKASHVSDALMLQLSPELSILALKKLSHLFELSVHFIEYFELFWSEFLSHVRSMKAPM